MCSDTKFLTLSTEKELHHLHDLHLKEEIEKLFEEVLETSLPGRAFPGEGFALSHHSPWVPYPFAAAHPHQNSLSVASRR